MNPADQQGMFTLRHEVFVDRLGWSVNSQNGMERDLFDDLPHAEYIIANAPDGQVNACWRLLPSTGPYMLRDTFPELLGGLPALCETDVWELSRFAVATDRVATSHGGFGPISAQLLAESARFALRHGIARYVTVTTLPIERMLKRQGLHMSRIAPPVKIGIVMAVACVIEVDHITLDAVGVSGDDMQMARNEHATHTLAPAAHLALN